MNFFYLFQLNLASVSVRNLRNIPKVSGLTVKPDPNDTLNRSLNHVNGTTNSYYGTTNYVKPSDSIYINGQVQQHQLQQQQQPQHIQDQYAVVKKTGSKRDIRENLERENSAIFKVIIIIVIIIFNFSFIYHIKPQLTTNFN